MANNSVCDIVIKQERPDYENNDCEARVLLPAIELNENVLVKAEAIHKSDEEEEDDDNFIPDIDVTKFLQEDHVFTTSSSTEEFNKRIFPKKGDKVVKIMKRNQILAKQSIHRKVSRTIQKDRKKKDRKVELERERRRELTELYDELQYWVEVGDSDADYQDRKR